MSAADHGPADSPLTREQVLDELEFLAKVEHALVVECLAVTSWLRRVSNSRTALSV
jgi:hypothetical protein